MHSKQPTTVGKLQQDLVEGPSSASALPSSGKEHYAVERLRQAMHNNKPSSLLSSGKEHISAADRLRQAMHSQLPNLPDVEHHTTAARAVPAQGELGACIGPGDIGPGDT